MKKMIKRAASHRFLISLIGSIGIMLLFYAVYLPSWEVNDDATINRLVDGSMGSYSTHLVYQNVVLGNLYTSLYKAAAGIPWYALFQYLLIGLSLTAIGYVLLNHLPALHAVGWYLLIALYCGFSCSIRMQFTKTAGLAALAGSILLLYCYKKSKERWFIGLILFALLLIGGGFALRYQQAALCIVMTGPAWLHELIPGAGMGRAEIKKHILRGAGLILAALCVCGILYGADKAAYRTQEWQYYRAFNRVRGKLFDHGFPNYDENAQALEALGLDKDAYDLLRSWTFADPDMYSLEVLQGIQDLCDEPDYINKANVKGFLKTVPVKIWNETIVYLFVSSLIFWALAGRHRKKDLLLALLLLIGFGILYYYFYVNGRYLYNRVDVPLFTAMTMTMLMLTEYAVGRRAGDRLADGKSADDINAGGRHTGRYIRVGIAAAAALGLLYFSLCSLHPISYYSRSGSWAAKQVKNRSGRQKKLENTAADTEHVYLTKVKVLHTSDSYGPFETAGKDVLSNVILLGGWNTWSPSYRQLLAQHDLTNPIQELGLRDDLLIADKDIELTVRYLEARLDMDLFYERVSKDETGLGKTKVYRVFAAEE